MTRTLQRMATPRPSTADEASRTVELTIASESDVGDGIVLSCRSLPEHGPIVPVLLSHQNNTAAMAGRLRHLRVENRQVVGLAEFIDAPAADEGWALARSGCAVSVGASVNPDGLQRQRNGPDLATRWTLREASLVPVPADANCLTRSQTLAPEAMTLDTSTNTAAADTLERDDEPQLTRAQLKRQRDCLRLAADAGITDPTWADRMIGSDNTMAEIQRAAVKAMRERLEGHLSPIGHPAHYPTPANQRDLAGVLAAKMGVKGDGIRREWAAMPMRSLLQETLANDPNSRGLDLAAMPITKLVNRAFSTSDFTKALESSTERLLLSSYEEAQVGVIALATSQDLADFRAMELIRVSQFGEISLKGEGGEYVTSDFAEELAGTLQAAEYGAIQPLTRKALANDSLDIFGRLVAEMGRASARKERSELVARLLGISFTGANSTTAPAATAAGIITGISNAALDLRRQTDAIGNPVSFQPRTVLVPPELEASARQALGTYSPVVAGEVNAFAGLRLEVDHYLTAGNIFYVADSAYPNLVIGRIGGGPIMSESEDFKTGNRLYRVASDFGTAVMDTRSICRVTI
jgi:hypothetical protein